MCGVSGVEFLVILIAAVIFLGPDRLPEAMRTLGKLMREVRKVTGEFSNVRDDFTKSLREESKSVHETVHRRESAGRAGQDVSDIDAIRAKRAAEEAQAAEATADAGEHLGDDAPAEETGAAESSEAGTGAAKAVASVAVAGALAKAPSAPDRPDVAPTEVVARELPEPPPRPAVQIRPAARSVATFQNPYRTRTSEEALAPASSSEPDAVEETDASTTSNDDGEKA